MPNLYHGTATPYLPAILRDGLRPMTQNRWKANLDSPIAFLFGPSEYGANGNWNQDDDVTGVYLAEDVDTAEAFAILRSRYLTAQPGQHVKPPTGWIGMVKHSDAPIVRDAKPVVLSVSLPDSWPLVTDEHVGQGDGSAKVSPKAIPPQYIRVLPNVNL